MNFNMSFIQYLSIFIIQAPHLINIIRKIGTKTRSIALVETVILDNSPIVCNGKLGQIHTGFNNSHIGKLTHNFDLMVIHMLAVPCQAWNSNDLFPVLYSTNNGTGTTMRYYDITGIHANTKPFAIQEGLMFHVDRSIITGSCLGECSIFSKTARNQIVYCHKQSVKLKFL